MKGPKLTRRNFLQASGSILARSLTPSFIPDAALQVWNTLSNKLFSCWVLDASDREYLRKYLSQSSHGYDILNDNWSDDLVAKIQSGISHMWNIPAWWIKNMQELEQWICDTYSRQYLETIEEDEKWFQALPDEIKDLALNHNKWSFVFDYNTTHIHNSLLFILHTGSSYHIESRRFVRRRIYFRKDLSENVHIDVTLNPNGNHLCVVCKDSRWYSITENPMFPFSHLEDILQTLNLSAQDAWDFVDACHKKSYPDRQVEKKSNHMEPLRKFLLSTTSLTPMSEYTKTTVEDIITRSLLEIEIQKIKMLLSSVIEVYTRS